MIFLTGDVHNSIKESWEQKSIGASDDIESAEKFLKILEKYKIKSTLFLNGSLLENNREKIKDLLKYDIEIGGHTYNNFGQMNIFKSYFNRKMFGCVYGSDNYQKKDILKTKIAFEKIGLKMDSWRTHSFASNEKTFEFLRDNGVKFVSDLLGNQLPFEKNGMIHVPINLPVDQNTMVYGNLSPENRDPFASCTKGRISSEEWFEIFKKRISSNERKKIPSIMLIHPMTMRVLDDFAMFEKIAKFLSKYESGKISDFKV